jgi:hypothetical protein
MRWFFHTSRSKASHRSEKIAAVEILHRNDISAKAPCRISLPFSRSGRTASIDGRPHLGNPFIATEQLPISVNSWLV